MMSAVLMSAFLAIPIGFALVALRGLGAPERKPVPVRVKARRPD